VLERNTKGGFTAEIAKDCELLLVGRHTLSFAYCEILYSFTGLTHFLPVTAYGPVFGFNFFTDTNTSERLCDMPLHDREAPIEA